MHTDRRHGHVVDRQFQSRFIAIAVMALVVGINVLVAAGFLLAEPLFLRKVTIPNVAALGLLEVAAVIGAYVFAMRASQRIAGPVYAMTRSVEQVGEGDLGVEVHLRRDDYFQAFGDDLNLSIAHLRERVAELKKTADELHRLLPDEGPQQEAMARLQRQLEAFRTPPGPGGAE